MYNIVNFIRNIAESIANIPRSIINGIGEFFADTIEVLQGIPRGIGIIIHDIFTPSGDQIEEEFEEITTGISTKFGFEEFDFEELFKNETPIEDTTIQYTVNGTSVTGKILDTRYLIQGVNYFRPYIRGFIALLIILYHIKQAMSLFGLDSGSITGQADITYQQYKGGRKE